MGSTLSPYQADLLRTHFDRVLLMLDGDEAGRLGVATIVRTLASHISVATITLGDAKQPDQLASEEIQRLLKEPRPERTMQQAAPISYVTGTVSTAGNASSTGSPER